MPPVRMPDGTTKELPDRLRIFAVFPIAKADDGDFVPDHDSTIRCEDLDSACVDAEQIARTAPYIAAIVFTRVCDFIAGECSKVEIITGFGDPGAIAQWTDY